MISHSLYNLLPSGNRYTSIRCRATRILSSFFPQAVRLLSSSQHSTMNSSFIWLDYYSLFSVWSFCVLLREIWLYNLVLHNDKFILTLESWMQIYQQPWMHHIDGRQSTDAAAVCSCVLTSKQSKVVSDIISLILNIPCLRQMSGPWSCSHWITDCTFSGV